MITMIKRDGTSTEIQPSESANTEGVAAPSTDTGANVQEPADPATTTEADNNTTADASADAAEDASDSILNPISTDRPAQDPETNARYAAARRAAEKQRDKDVQLARTEAETAAKTRIEGFIKSLNLRDDNGKLISTEEEYTRYTQAKNSRQSTQDASAETGITPERVDELLSAHPDVQAARDAREQLTQTQEELMRERVNTALNAELGKVREAFPEISSIDDIIRLPRYADIKAKVAAGYTLSDAVRLIYEDAYIKRRSAAAAQQARNAATSTAHLSATRTHGSGGVNVTEAQIKAFMDAIPGATREQAIRAYNKYNIHK